MALDDIGSAAVEGEGTGGSSPNSKEVEGLRAALQAERSKRQASDSKIAELTAKVDALSQKPAKEYSRSELQQAVDDGRMSQMEADRILDQQLRKTVATDVTRQVKSELEADSLKQKLNEEIDKYTTVYPDILVDGSEKRVEVAREFQRQLSLGKPNNLQTELDALMAVFGPSHRLQKGREKELQTTQEVGSDGGGETPKQTSTPKLPSRVKAHYENLISKGIYKGWDDPNLVGELKFVRER